jgi:hypothetical protein
MGVAEGAARNGTKCGYIRSIDDKCEGFGTFMQMCKPNEYLGKRVKLSAWIKTADVEGWAGLWMRVDGQDNEPSLAFDNMQDRPIEGTTDWKQYDVILDVAESATAIAFGVLVVGKGTAWLDDFHFEIVPDSVPSSAKSCLNEKATNLNFEG